MPRECLGQGASYFAIHPTTSSIKIRRQAFSGTGSSHNRHRYPEGCRKLTSHVAIADKRDDFGGTASPQSTSHSSLKSISTLHLLTVLGSSCLARSQTRDRSQDFRQPISLAVSPSKDTRSESSQPDCNVKDRPDATIVNMTQ